MFFHTKPHPLPRMLVRPFNEGLKSVYKSVFGKDLQILYFGKPEASSYKFGEDLARKKYGAIKKFVMVGDNEQTDILGAHNYGWDSVLVTTGVSKDVSPLATYTRKDVLEAL